MENKKMFIATFEGEEVGASFDRFELMKKFAKICVENNLSKKQFNLIEREGSEEDLAKINEFDLAMLNK